MAYLFNGARVQVILATGVESGAQVFTYQAGTLIPQVTFPTQFGNTPNTNPIICDANGQAAVWFLPGLGYRVIVKRSVLNGGATISDDDNLSGALDLGGFSGLAGSVFAGSYATFDLAVAAAAGKKLVVGPGTYPVTANLDAGSAVLEFLPGALVTVSAGIILTIRKQIIAGDYKIFASTGTVISAGERNPFWWGAVASLTSPGATIAAANTLAFRKAAMSFYSEYVLNAGTLAVPGPCIPFSVQIPEGLFYLSNGFAAPVGAPVRGSGASTCLSRLSSNADTDTAIPLLTVGQSLAAAPGLAYQNDPGTGQSSGTFAAAGFAQTAAAAQDLYFVDQNPSMGAFAPRYPGCQFHDLFFTSCGIAINLGNTADMTGTNIVIDMGLTGIAMGNCQNIRLTNVILYYQTSQAISVGSNVFDCSIDAHIEYPQGIAVNVSGSVVRNLKFPNMTVTQNGSTGTNAIVINGNDIDIEFQDAAFRNLGGCAAVQIAGLLTNVALRFKSPIFDSTRTNPVYNQNINMQAFNVSSGAVYVEDAVMKNLGVRSIVAGMAALSVNGLRYSNMATAASVFDLSGCTGGDAEFFNVKGDATVPLLTGGSPGAANVRVKGSSDWLGAIGTDGAFYAWNLPLPAYGQIMATVSAQPDGTAGVRKSASVIYERSVEGLPALTDTLGGVVLYASPTTNAHVALAPSLVFSSTNTATDTTSPGTPKVGKLRVPNTYNPPILANIDYLA